MIIVFDTNVWLSDLALTSSVGSAVRFYLREQNARIALPEVIKLETEIHLRSTLNEHIEEIQKNHRQLLAVFGRLKEVVLPTPDEVEALIGRVAEASETYHHWRVFSHGSDGVCIELDKDALTASLTEDQRIRYGTVTYKMINDVSLGGIETNDLPFLKRYPYRDEKEFRLLYMDMDEIKEFHYVPISLQNIVRVTLSPWMPKPLSDTLVR